MLQHIPYRTYYDSHNVACNQFWQLQGSAPNYGNDLQNVFAESNREWSREYAKRKYAKQRKVFVE